MNKPDRTAIKQQWTDILNSGRKVTFEWDCGGDETIVDLFVDGENQSQTDEAEDLIDVIIEELQLPNAGEYFVHGKAELLQDGDQLKINHTSQHSGVSWDHVDVDAPGFNASEFDWEANAVVFEKEVSETVTLIY